MPDTGSDDFALLTKGDIVMFARQHEAFDPTQTFVVISPRGVNDQPFMVQLFDPRADDIFNVHAGDYRFQLL